MKDQFGAWLDNQGYTVLSKKLKVCGATLRGWRLGKNFPSVKHMQRIKKISNGEISYSMIIDRRPSHPSKNVLLTRKNNA